MGNVGRKQIKQYNHSGFAGCVNLQRSRQTGKPVGVYHGLQSGLNDDEENTWLVLCEEHGNICECKTLTLANDLVRTPLDWCEDCQAEFKGR